MADQFSLLEMPMVGGIDEHTDPNKVQGAAVLRAENCQITKYGRYDKRYGTAAVTTTMLSGTALASSNANLHARGGELLIAERARLLARCAAKDRLITEDTLPEWNAETIPVAQAAGVVVDQDIATIVSGTANYTCIVYGTEGTSVTGAQKIMAVIVDGNNQRTLVNLTQLSSGTNGYGPRVTYSGNVFICVWSDGAGNIKGRRIDMSASVPAWDTAVTLRNDQTGTAQVFDVCTGPSAGTWTLAYQKGAAPNITIDLYRYDNTASLTQQSTGSTGEAISVNFLSIGLAQFVAGSYLVCCYTYQSAAPTNFARATVFNPTTLGVVTARFTIQSSGSAGVADAWSRITCCGVASNFQVAWFYGGQSYGAAFTGNIWAEVVNPLTGALVGLTKNLFGAIPVSKLLSTNGSTYGVVCAKASAEDWNAPTAGDVLDGNIILCRFYGEDTTNSATQPQPVATIEPRIGDGSQDSQHFSHNAGFASDADQTTTSFVTVYGYRSLLLYPASLPYSGTPCQAKIARVTLEAGKRQSCELGGLTYLSGGTPCYWDGFRVAEVGFLEQPHAVAAKAGGGSMTADSTYRYAIVYVHHDTQGNVHRSTPWKMSVALGVGETKVTLTIPYYGCTRRQSVAKQIAFSDFGPPSIEIYRTVSGGAQFRLLKELIPNLTTSDRTTYVDTAADSVLGSQPYLYDTATPDGRSQLAHVCPPSATLCMTHRDRVWFAGCPNRKEVWVSSKYVPGEAPFFSEEFRIVVDDGGDITAIASMDDKAVLFKDDRIFVVTGDGPDDSGSNSDWSPATRLMGTVGCIEPRSVVVTPMGVMFQSRVGLSLLTRDLQVVAEFGRPVEDSLSGRTIVAATLHKTKTEVRFLLSTGNEIRYDYHHKVWLYATGLKNGSAKWVNNTLYYLGSGSMVSEDSTLYTDSGVFVSSVVELAPVAAAGQLGYQDIAEVQVLCDHYTDHELKIEVSYDGSSYAASNAVQFSAATLGALSPTLYPLSFKPLGAGKSRIAKARISDLTPTSGTLGTGRSYGLISATFKVAPKEGPAKIMGSSQKG